MQASWWGSWYTAGITVPLRFAVVLPLVPHKYKFMNVCITKKNIYNISPEWLGEQESIIFFHLAAFIDVKGFRFLDDKPILTISTLIKCCHIHTKTYQTRLCKDRLVNAPQSNNKQQFLTHSVRKHLAHLLEEAFPNSVLHTV